MAKKQQPKLSYGPNTGLIAGEAQVAASEAGLANVGQSFVTGVASMFAAIKQEEKQRQDKVESYMSTLPSLEQSFLMENASNKQVVRSFLNKQRDEFAKYAEIYENTKDRNALDKMDEIKFSLANLDDQIKVFNTDKAEYLKASDEKQLANGQIYESDFFTDVYTDNSSFIITESGDISFERGGKQNTSKLYKDHAGNWLPKDNINEEFNLRLYDNSYSAGEQGKSFNRKSTYASINANLKSTGSDGIMTMATTDLTNDDSSLTFQQQWASGSLDENFYKNRKKEDGFDWMFKNENADELRGLLSDYLTNVMEDGHTQGKSEYKGSGRGANYIVNGVQMSKSTFDESYGSMVTLIQNPEEGMAASANGFNFEYRDGQHYGQDDKENYTVPVSPRLIASRTGLLGYTTTETTPLSNIDLGGEEEIPYPDRDITSSNFNAESSKLILSKLRTTYKDYPDFKFDYESDDMLKITAPNGTESFIEMDRTLRGNKESRKAIQQFIIDNIDKK